MWRKRNKCLFRLLSLLLPCALLCSGCGTWGKNTAEEMEEHTRGVFAMGTYMVLTAYGEGAEDVLHGFLYLKPFGVDASGGFTFSRYRNFV